MRALGELERLVNRYGASQFQGQVWLEMAEAYAAVGDLARAQQLWRQTKETFPGSPAASRAQARSRAIRNGSVSREEP
jgi:TolA-binding protein